MELEICFDQVVATGNPVGDLRANLIKHYDYCKGSAEQAEGWCDTLREQKLQRDYEAQQRRQERQRERDNRRLAEESRRFEDERRALRDNERAEELNREAMSLELPNVGAKPGEGPQQPKKRKGEERGSKRRREEEDEDDEEAVIFGVDDEAAPPLDDGAVSPACPADELAEEEKEKADQIFAELFGMGD